jgi:hypothetical protein
MMPKKVFDHGNGVECWEMRAYTVPGYPPCTEFYVYRGDHLVRVCPSIGMAHEVAAGC